MAARAAAAELPTESGDVHEKFSWIATGLGEAVEDLQELSRGIHPAILSDAGLGPALETLALRSPIPVELEVRTRERFPEPVEVAAYFTASESLANAAKHSQASRITVLLAFENERLRLSVRDDGIGRADPARGSGLVGLRDRVEALGGTLAIESGSGGGTTLSATLPVGDDPDDPTIYRAPCPSGPRPTCRHLVVYEGKNSWPTRGPNVDRTFASTMRSGSSDGV